MLTGHLLEHRLRGQHGAVDLQDLLLLDEVLSPHLQDVVLQGTPHRAKVVQAAHAWRASHSFKEHKYSPGTLLSQVTLSEPSGAGIRGHLYLNNTFRYRLWRAPVSEQYLQVQAYHHVTRW